MSGEASKVTHGGKLFTIGAAYGLRHFCLGLLMQVASADGNISRSVSYASNVGGLSSKKPQVSAGLASSQQLPPDM